MSLLGMWLWLGCASGTTATNMPAAELTPPPVPGTETEANESCVNTCMRDNMARAVSADLIKEECARQCQTESTKTLPTLGNDLQPSL